jgi:outer membrane receptor protein involved in Fe transport
VSRDRDGGADLRVQRLGGFSLTGAHVIGPTPDRPARRVSTARQRELLRGQGLVERVEARSAAMRRFHSVDLTASQELWQAPTWKSLVQAGVHGRREHARSATLAGVAPIAHSPLDITTGEAVSPLVASEAGLAWAGWSDASYANAFVQNQTSLFSGRVVTTLGLGAGRNEPAPGDVRASGAMPNAAIVLNLSPQWAVYASYATSFNPVDPDAEDAAGRRGTFNASRGTNLEVGLKADAADRRYSVAASVFHNDIGNALVQSGASDLNPNGNRYFVAVGTRRSRGVEVSVEARPRSAVRVQASASLLDASIPAGPPSAATTAIPGSRPRSRRALPHRCGRSGNSEPAASHRSALVPASCTRGRGLVAMARGRRPPPTRSNCRRSPAWTSPRPGGSVAASMRPSTSRMRLTRSSSSTGRSAPRSRSPHPGPSCCA